MIDILIFDVELWQSIFVYPHASPFHWTLIDCWNTTSFHPVDFLKEKFYLPLDQNWRAIIDCIAISNYDQDHFSWLPYIRENMIINRAYLPTNLEAQEIIQLKETITDPIEKIIEMKSTFTDHTGSIKHLETRPFHITPISLLKSDFPELESSAITTNDLSQMYFIEYEWYTMCICWDLTERSWEKILQREVVIEKLQKTNTFIASHHWRDNGFHPDIFKHCSPECVIISDKGIVHSTQEWMTQKYWTKSSWILFNGTDRRKVLTTRYDWHIWLRVQKDGSRIYNKFSI